MNKEDFLRGLRLYVTGFCMGAADLVPGVSGGTIAFISGIYEELLRSINLVTGKALQSVLRRELRSAVALIPFRFLVPLALGMGTALFGLAHTISWLLATYPQPVWGLFFGLVLASVGIVIRRVKVWVPWYVVVFLLSILTAFFLVGLSPVETSLNNWTIFASGFIAICAMILPGISGSFILLLLGKYNQILAAVVEKDIGILALFILGCVLGISIFSRFLTWLFLRYHDISVVILAGIMLGSLRKIWPWQIEGRIVLPTQFDGGTVIVILCIVLGFSLIFWLNKQKLLKERTQDIPQIKASVS